MGHLHTHTLITLALSAALCACEPAPTPPSPTTEATPTPDNQPAPSQPPTPQTTPTLAAKLDPNPTPKPPRDPRFPRKPANAESALALGNQFREIVQGPDLEVWLRHYATWPLDIEGAEAVHSPRTLPQALTAHPPWRVRPTDTTCVTITREALLAGDKPWHWLDRLGERPPTRELGRDLDKLGLLKGRWWVNCYLEDEAGYTLIIEADETNHARVRAIRD